MKIKSFLALMLGLLIFVSGCGTGEAPATTEDTAKTDDAKEAALTEDEVKTALESLRTSVEKNDADGISKIYADDYMIVNPDGAAQTKAERMEAMKSGSIKYEKVEFSDPKIRIYGNTAVVVTNAKGKAQQDGKDTDMDMTATIVFVKTADGVREVSAHLTDKAKAE